MDHIREFGGPRAWSGDLPSIRSALLDWSAIAGRTFPWRDTRDPFAILIAEMMLRRTQVRAFTHD